MGSEPSAGRCIFATFSLSSIGTKWTSSLSQHDHTVTNREDETIFGGLMLSTFMPPKPSKRHRNA